MMAWSFYDGGFAAPCLWNGVDYIDYPSRNSPSAPICLGEQLSSWESREICFIGRPAGDFLGFLKTLVDSWSGLDL
jgi:hypothetical protein